MEDLNILLNTALRTANENYCDTAENIEKCRKKFYDLSSNDNTALNVCLYLFPFSPLEKNSKEFWFQKYKDDNKYDEFDFALDVLRSYINYLSEKNSGRYNSRIIESAKKFGNYKHVDEFLSIILDYVDESMAIDAYLTKDNFYFEKILELKVSPEQIQTLDFLKIIKKQIDFKKDYYKLNRKYNSLINLFQDSESVKKDIIQDLRNQIQNLNTEVTTLRGENVEIKERLDKIDLRDTIKMSFKYLYNILRTKFNTEPEANNFRDQSQQIKKILSREEYSKYKYLARFIEDIEFTKLYDLNTATHNSDIEERQLSNIKKYMQNISDTDLNKVVDFFNNLQILK